jgi:hypothetical protein
MLGIASRIIFLHLGKNLLAISFYFNSNLIMRIEYIQTSKKNNAKVQCPWATKIAKVIGGFVCFESVEDYNTWSKQK